MTELRGLGDLHRLDPGWARALEPATGRLEEIAERLKLEEDAGRGFLPAPEHILRAFEAPLDDVRVLIVGQDPYPTPGHPIGLSFATDRHVRPLPRSLANIYRELHDDLGIEAATTGDLSRWSAQGVLLLNRVLTVGAGTAGSHRAFGWQSVTDLAIEALVARQRPLVAILWGKDAQALAPLLGETPTLVSAHPSPLSASRGFFGSRPFSRTNELLRQQGADPVDWRVVETPQGATQPPLF
ncbi:uracil-DNA glycosylase [Pseudoclavibacter sp. Z016]|uniref:uracil-DNA glycosylase n=1 Tax=Pseudoclavibacter sp. Z016 TaxID=2080581 RepID=UPI000CE72ABC|nr:uracil-DNA glycosylase [Pseudoclavibacter sp. Z016]PPF76105.1 uracil-DNA glycosylase [Pseudoclavibacter sp. Z016]